MVHVAEATPSVEVCHTCLPRIHEKLRAVPCMKDIPFARSILNTTNTLSQEWSCLRFTQAI